MGFVVEECGLEFLVCYLWVVLSRWFQFFNIQIFFLNLNVDSVEVIGDMIFIKVFSIIVYMELRINKQIFEYYYYEVQ